MNDKCEGKGKIILLPQIADLKTEIEKLGIELSLLVLERDTLVFVECRNIEMKYMLELGHLEVKSFELECEYLRLRRKSELIRAKLNRQEQVDLKEIEKELDKEFASFKIELERRISDVEKAVKWKNLDRLSPENDKEIKNLYRKIVKSLHPDLHPKQTEREKDLFFVAVKAYKNADLESIRIIYYLIENKEEDRLEINSIVELEKEKQRLKSSIENINKNMEEIRNSYPYNLKKILHDENEVSRRKEELEKIFETYKKYVEIYKEEISKMVG